MRSSAPDPDELDAAREASSPRAAIPPPLVAAEPTGDELQIPQSEIDPPAVEVPKAAEPEAIEQPPVEATPAPKRPTHADHRTAARQPIRRMRYRRRHQSRPRSPNKRRRGPNSPGRGPLRGATKWWP